MARAIAQAGSGGGTTKHGDGGGSQSGRAGARKPSALSRLQRALVARARLLGVLFAGLGLIAATRGASGSARGETPQHALAAWLHRRGLEVDPHEVVWLASETNLFGERPALFIARTAKELRDVYYADVRLAGSAVLDARSLTNITRTSSADEDQLVAAGPFVAYPARVGSSYDALVVLDARGQPAALTAGWPWYAKIEDAISNLQDTGRTHAFGVRRYAFGQAPSALTLSRHEDRFALELRDIPGKQLSVRVEIDPARDQPLVGAEAVELERAVKGQPGLITWVVDTVRRVPWIGRAPVEWLEHTVFDLTDKANRAYHEVVATDTAAEVKEALVVSEPPAPKPQPAPDPSLPPSAAKEEPPIPDWPPAALTPVLPDHVRGEGAWLPVADAFAPQAPTGDPLFYQTFIRVDPERSFTRVYVTLWDARQVQLGIVMGTKEPESATGETGSGEVPRDPFVISHLVGAFNGGFQAMHGEFGMMAEGHVYLPPKPYAATVAVFDDGRVGMGSWPGPGRKAWDEELANAQIPSGMIAMRQNLTSVVEGDKYNPWERWWWGAAPTWAEEQTYIPRSGLCLTREGFLAYFWGESMGPEELGKAMLATRCVRGLHLDMNGKHTGFEFYRGFAPGTALPSLGRALGSSEFEGSESGMRGYRFRARLAVTTMTPISFPRYLDRDPRDFFYLTRKAVLPGAPLELAGQPFAFSTAGLPSEGYPHAFARAELPEASVTRIDVSRAVPAMFADASAGRVLAALGEVVRAPSAGAPEVALQGAHELGRLRLRVAPAAAHAQVLARGPLVTEASTALAALGVDGEGLLVFVSAKTPSALRGALAAAGVNAALGFESADFRLAAARPAELPDAGAPDAAAAPAAPAGSLTFVAETRAPAAVLFGDVKPKGYRYWGWLQDQRVRYFPAQHSARFPTPDGLR